MICEGDDTTAKISMVWFDRAENARPSTLEPKYGIGEFFNHKLYDEDMRKWQTDYGITDE